MAEIVVTQLNAEKKRKARSRKARYRRIRQPDGRVETIYTIDLASPDFGVDFGKVFQSAVNKARRENKLVIGAADVEPPKQ